MVNEVTGHYGSIEAMNTVFASFTPQCQYSINVVMRFPALRRSTPGSWRRYAGKVNWRFLYRYDASLWGSRIRLVSPRRAVMNRLPRVAGYGSTVALVVDYRLFFDQRRYYAFYRRVAGRLASTAQGPFEGFEGALQYGLLGFGPTGLYQLPVDEGFDEEAISVEEAFSDALVKALKDMLQGCGPGSHILIDVYYPSRLEATLFLDDVMGRVEEGVEGSTVLDGVESIAGCEALRRLVDLLDRYDVVVLVVTDPLPPLSLLRAAAVSLPLDPGQLARRLFVIHYIGLYMNVAAYYYKLLERLVGDKARYVEAARRIPVLALSPPGAGPEEPPSFDLVLPVEPQPAPGSMTSFKVATPDVFVTRYREVVSALRLLPRRIVKSLNMRLDAVLLSGGKAALPPAPELLDEVAAVIKRRSVDEAIRAVREPLIAARLDTGRGPRVLYIDDLRREP